MKNHLYQSPSPTYKENSSHESKKNILDSSANALALQLKVAQLDKIKNAARSMWENNSERADQEETWRRTQRRSQLAKEKLKTQAKVGLVESNKEELERFKNHMAGEISSERATGGHVKSLMQNKFGNDLEWVDGIQPKQNVPSNATWKVQDKIKKSTFFPAIWSWEQIKEKLAYSWQSKNKWVDGENWQIRKTGDTFYPIGF